MRWLIGAMLAMAAAGVALSGPVLAQAAKADAKKNADAKAQAPKKDPVELQKLVDAAIAAYEAGRIEPAIQQFTAAISAGGMPTQLLARAYYFRGAAYRKQGKPAQALTDLTSALWLKNGLTDSERKLAIEERSAAYRDAGLPDQTIETAAKAASQPQTDEGGSTGFLGNLFGGGSSAAKTAAPAAAKSAPVETAAVATAPQGWQAATKSPDAPSSGAVRAAGGGTPAKGWAANTVSTGTTSVPAGATFRLQIATLRTRAEAQELAARLKADNKADLVNRETEVIETPMASLGNIYRIKVGPFADVGQAQSVCAKIRNGGQDCMIVRD